MSFFQTETLLEYQHKVFFNTQKGVYYPFLGEALSAFFNQAENQIASSRSYYLIDFNDFLRFTSSPNTATSKTGTMCLIPNHSICFFEWLPETRQKLPSVQSKNLTQTMVGGLIGRNEDTLTIGLVLQHTFDPKKFECLYLELLLKTEATFLEVPMNDLVKEVGRYLVGFSENQPVKSDQLFLGFEFAMSGTVPRLLVNKLHKEFISGSFSKTGELYKYLTNTNYHTHNQSLLEDQLQVLFQLIGLFIFLPGYLQFRHELVRIDRSEKKSQNQLIRTPQKNGKQKLQLVSKVIYKTIRSIRILPEHKIFSEISEELESPIVRQLPTQSFQVNSHWRKLTKPWAIGHDQFGNQVLGKTWVKSYEKYTHLQPPSEQSSQTAFSKPTVIYIKEPAGFDTPSTIVPEMNRNESK